MHDYDQYFTLLDLGPESSQDDIRRRYRYLKNFYGGDSIEILALHDDFNQELRADYLARLERAFEKLSALGDNARTVAAAPANKDQQHEAREWIEQVACLDGAALKTIRERQQVDLASIFAVTRIQLRYLEDIEAEAFGSFPAEVYLRSYLIEYSRCLGLDSRRVLDDYLPRYRAWAASRS